MNGRILIRGNFGNVGGFARPGVARLWPNGVVDPDFAKARDATLAREAAKREAEHRRLDLAATIKVPT